MKVDSLVVDKALSETQTCDNPQNGDDCQMQTGLILQIVNKKCKRNIFLVDKRCYNICESPGTPVYNIERDNKRDPSHIDIVELESN